MGQRLYEYWQRFATSFRTKTRDGAPYAYHYLSGLLRMTGERNFANIGRQTGVPGQNVQHFMANSPWSAESVLRQVQQEIAAKPALAGGGMLLLDESADAKAGLKSAGAARQYNGRLGKVDVSQVGTFLAYANVPAGVWTWIDGELFLPEHWLSQAMAGERKRLGVPADRPFATKVELGWRMIQRVQATGVPFEAVACDDLYGRSTWLRRQLDQAGICYMADVPADTQVYLTEPAVGVPPRAPDQRGRPPSRPRVLSLDEPIPVSAVARREDTVFERVRVRSTERGEIHDPFAVRRVWTTRDRAVGVPVTEEWLVIRREADGTNNYSLSNAAPDTAIERLAWLKCQRYFIERANQDAKSDLGWDELQAQKYRAWEHHLALTVLATWFVAETKLDWAQQAQRDPSLAAQLGVEMLPRLSAANVRELLRAVLPLPHLTPQEATALVVQHLVNRTRSTKSRLKRRHRPNSASP